MLKRLFFLLFGIVVGLGALMLLLGAGSLSPTGAGSVLASVPVAESGGMMVTAVQPPANSHTAALSLSIHSTFDRPVSATTVHSGTFVAHVQQLGHVVGTYSVNGDTAQLDFVTALPPGTRVQTSITTDTLGLDGVPLEQPHVWQFQTAPQAGSGLFEADVTLGNLQVRDAAVGDLDGDADIDIFLAHRGEGNRIWLNQGGLQGGEPGTFIQHGQSLGTADSVAVALGDADNDGDLDVLVANDGQPNVLWFNNGFGLFGTSVQINGTSTSRSVAWADFDGDGDLDIVVANALNESNSLFINQGGIQGGSLGVFADSGFDFGAANSQDVAVGDVDRDGDLDLVFANDFAQGNQVWLNDSAGGFTLSAPALGNGWSLGLDLGDVDGDGDLDLLVANGSLIPEDHLWINQGGVQGGSEGSYLDAGALFGSDVSNDVSLGDVDADGDLDLLVAQAITNALWINDGHGNFWPGDTDWGVETGRQATMADFDGDGALDVAIVGDIGSVNRLWFNQTSLLVMVALSYDNIVTSPVNLSRYFPETLDAIIKGSTGDLDQTTVVLADLDQDGDTYVFVVHDGVVTPVVGLPDATGVLSPTLLEYDMTDGVILGGFIRWARLTYPAARSIFSYVGHGAPLVPETDINLLTQGMDNQPLMPAIPLPSWVAANPDFTDRHPAAILSAHDLAVALGLGTAGGPPIDVLDLVHCFGLTAEEAYEVSPYVRSVTGSPNYVFFDPIMPGGMLDVARASSSDFMAAEVIEAYDELLPADDHPRILVAVESRHLEAVKRSWDEVSAALMAAFAADPADTRNRITAAYQTSAGYDTTYCQADWELGRPDALSDMRTFANGLAVSFGPASLTGQWALTTTLELESAVISSQIRNGQPWFVLPPPTWTFNGIGVGLYTDFESFNMGGTDYINWQAHWYTDTVTVDNPNPFAFISNSSTGSNWADVLVAFWAGQSMQTAFCMPELPPVSGPGEMAAACMPEPLWYGNVSANEPLWPAVTIATGGPLRNQPQVSFSIWQTGTLVYSDTVSVNFPFTGTHLVSANNAWVPPAGGSEFTLSVTADSDDRVWEGDEGDNTLLRTSILIYTPPPGIEATIAGNSSWITDSVISLALTPTTPISWDRVKVQYFQYEPGQLGPVLVPTSVWLESIYAPFSGVTDITLPPALKPGVVEMQLWPFGGPDAPGRQPQTPGRRAVIRFNYAPPSATIGADEAHYFDFSLTRGDVANFDLTILSGNDVDLFLWAPYMRGQPTMVGNAVGDDSLALNPAPMSGAYLVQVLARGPGSATYTLLRTGSGTLVAPVGVGQGAMSFAGTVPDTRPFFEAPTCQPPPLQQFLPVVARP